MCNSCSFKGFIKTTVAQGYFARNMLINTGWSDHYQDPDEKKLYSMRPGISFNAAKFLASKR